MSVRGQIPSWRYLLPALLGAVVVGVALCQKWSPSPDPPAGGAGASPGPPLFRDMTGQSGVCATYRNGEEADLYTLLETLGGGVALLDYDGDGLLDIFVTGGGYFQGQAIQGHPSKLYRNLGRWRFQEVTHEVGL